MIRILVQVGVVVGCALVAVGVVWTTPLQLSDPLAGLAILCGGSLTLALLAGLLLVVLTRLRGPWFCTWLCPLGSLLDASALVLRPLGQVPYWLGQARWVLLAGLVTACVLGLQMIGLVDPVSLVLRALAGPWDHGAGLLGLGLLGLILATSLLARRWFCAVLCPLGALLRLCAPAPADACATRSCLACDAAPACRQRRLPRGADPTRRGLVLGVLGGMVAVPVWRACGGTADARLLRPPGVVDGVGEATFLDRCLRCGACVAACPQGVLVPDGGRAGLGGLFAPRFAPERGHCDPTCRICARVCPSGAIPASDQVQRLGSAHIDRRRCRAWMTAAACTYCREACAQEAITLRGTQPVIDSRLCIGCGACEEACRLQASDAIRVLPPAAATPDGFWGPA